MEGYSKRFASRIAHHAVMGSIDFGIASWRHETRRYQRSGLDGNWPRLKHAVVGTFWVPRTDGAGNTLRVGMLAGDFGSAAISRAWHPESSRTVGRVFTGGILGVGIDTGVNVIREFWPWKKWKP
jgi:hypothetical protein